jgi:hypothetical protein
MSIKRLRKGLALVGGFIITLSGLLPDRGLPLLLWFFKSASSHPIRAVFVVVGLALIAYALKDQLLDLLGVRTPKRLEADVRGWLETFSFSIKRQTKNEAHFEFLATPEKGIAIQIGNYKEMEHYVIIAGRVSMSEPDKLFFDAMPEEDQAALAANLSIILSRTRAFFQMDLRGNDILIEKRVPVTADLSEHVFISAIQDFVSARIGALSALNLMLRDAVKRAERAERAAGVPAQVPVPIPE